VLKRIRHRYGVSFEAVHMSVTLVPQPMLERRRRRLRVLPHIKKLDDCFGQFLMRVICDCGAMP
jgi:hypothetical protein